MRSASTTFTTAAAVAALALLAGCAAPMRLAPELASANGIAVQDRNHWNRPMTFGQWQVAAPPTFSTRGWKIGLGGGPLPKNAELSLAGERASADFDVSSPASASTHGNCLAQGKFGRMISYGARITDETQVTLPGFPRLDCEFSGSLTGVMTLKAEFPSMRDNGVAEFGARRWQVRSVNNLQGQSGSFPLARFGYELLRETRVVAAVEIQGNGRVWMTPGLSPDEQNELSTLMTALLYYGELLALQDA
jgi:hypothetical protein